MGKIRRGGYVFVTWIGNHSPYHVRVGRDRDLVLKWDLENDVPTKGEPSRRLLDLIEELREGRAAVKIKSVTANNRKKAFEVSTASETYSFPYALLRVQPDSDNRIAEVYPDADLGLEGFTYRLADGQEDTIHLDAVLEYNRDPAYLKNLLLHRLTVEAQKAVASSDLSKRELIRSLGTSASQFYRLLDSTNHTKSVGQMLALLHLLGREVDVVVSPARPPERRSRTRSKRRGGAAV